MPTLDKLIMLSLAVSDMSKSKEFYESKLGFKVTKDYGKDGMHWVSLELPGGGATITLTTAHENMKPGAMKLYVSTSDIEQAYSQLDSAGASKITDDLYGPGSGVRWFNLNDPDGNQLLIVATE